MESIQRNIQQFFSSWWRGDLFELTYAYTSSEERFFNRTLFWVYWWCTLDMSPEELTSTVRKQLENDITYCMSLYEWLKWSHWKTTIYKKALQYTIQILELIRRWVPFEVEKWHNNRTWTWVDFSRCLQEVKEREKKIFGDPIQFSPIEVAKAYCFFQLTFEKYSSELSAIEQDKFLQYVTSIKELPVWNSSFCHIQHEESLLDHNCFDLLISREVYITLFKKVFALYDLDIWVIQDERSSIYDGHDTLYIPVSGWYDQLPLRRVLKLIAHEIETHYIVLHNTDKILWWVKWGYNLAREEWLAMLQEYLLTWSPLEHIEMTDTIPLILMGEILPGADLLNFLNIYRKLHWFNAVGNERLLRSKRNYPLLGQGVQHKDVTYSRWIYQVKQYLEQGKLFWTLFLAKVDFTDLALLEKQVDVFAYLQPKFIAMRLMFACLSWWNNQQYAQFIAQAEKTYWSLLSWIHTHFSDREQQIYDALVDVLHTCLAWKNNA